jgi:nitrate reductase assembly molybdenum cofactor insertion protein NarJ
MTGVIGGGVTGAYGGAMAARDDVQRVAATLRRPGVGYVKRVRAHAAAVAVQSGEAARQLALFAERVADLTTPELQELHDETFGRGRAHGAAREALRLARHRSNPGDVRASLDLFAPLLERLDAERNPFAFVVRALCCVLLARTREDTMTRRTPQIQP